MLATDVVLLPRDLDSNLIRDRAVVVFDILRATTSMTAALAAGVKEIRIFPDLDSARSAAGGYTGRRLLCGEQACLPPPGFDLGNSPGQFLPSHAGATLFMCTTNGTRAIIAARTAPVVLTGALVNAAAVATRLAQENRNLVLLCAGTNGKVAMEDAIGAGAVLDELSRRTEVRLESDVARMAKRLFEAAKADLQSALADAQGGRNVTAAGLEPDIAFAARLNALDAVGVVKDEPLRVMAA
jgi:2-phosphosulfolactate phosphatase